jgi:histidine ammonia-lyase
MGRIRRQVRRVVAHRRQRYLGHRDRLGQRAAQRNFLPGSEDGGFGQNDVAPPSFPAWRAQEEAGACLEACLAVLAAVASQAFHVTERTAPPALADLLESVRAVFAPVSASRPLGEDLGRLAVALRAEIYEVAPRLAD